MDSRYQKEAAFHDHAFSEHVREKVEKYYSISECSRAAYRRLLQAQCGGRTVLEYGCGVNCYAFALGRWGATVTAIDISSYAVEQCRRIAERDNRKEVNFLVMNADDLTFGDNTFDLVCGNAILHHLDLDRSLSEIVRTLKPNGVALFKEPLGHNPAVNLYRRLTPKLRTEDERPFLVKDLEAMKKYFGRIEVSYYHMMSLLAFPLHKIPALFHPAVKVLDAVDRFLFRILPFTRRYAWTMILSFSQPNKDAVLPRRLAREGAAD